MSYPEYVKVHIPDPTTPIRYLDGLHEIGHVVSPKARHYYERWSRTRPHWSSTDYDDCILMEAAAWAWAAYNVHTDLAEQITRRVWRGAGAEMGSYLEQLRFEKFGKPRRKPRKPRPVAPTDTPG